MARPRRPFARPVPRFVRLVQAYKEHFLDFYGEGFCPPYVLVERGDETTHIVQTQAETGHATAPVLRVLHGMLPHDSLVLVCETNFQIEMKGMPITGTEEEAIDEFRRKFPPGRLQELAESGKAGEYGIIDAVCALCKPNGAPTRVMWILPYVYAGPGTRFMWLSSQFECLGDPEEGRSRIAGSLPEILDRACSGPRAADLIEVLSDPASSDDPDLRAMGLRPADISDFAELPTDEREQLMTELTLKHLEQRGCAIFTSFASFGSPQP